MRNKIALMQWKFVLAGMLLVTLAAFTATAGQFDHLLDKLGKHDSNKQAATQLPGSEIASGLKEALAQGTTNAIKSLGRSDGFWKNSAVRIPLPKSVRDIGKLARQLGQGDKVDAFELSLNRAAEKAVPQVADIFGEAIRKMSLSDARGILTGGDHAATDYFRRVAGDALKARIEPIVSKATDSVGATQKYKALMSGSTGKSLGGALSMLGGHDKKDSHASLNLDDYVTEKTMDGLFSTIGNEEKSIRSNPAARTTDLLKKVFGGH
ncbi:MAG: DUF4197 domain-containing protein [Xanthomonadales bacterium]|nr:DUF4197 domain-containing protein [Xanthomonadales bacterium]